MGIPDPVAAEIPTDLGLSTSLPETKIAPGQLLVARNKAPEKWGPRHGMTLLDRVTRGRGNPQFNGTTSFVEMPYNTLQCDLGVVWSVTCYFRMGTVGTAKILFSFGINSKGALYGKLNADGTVTVEVRDNASGVATLTSQVVLEANDVLMIHIVREGSLVSGFFGKNGTLALEAVSSADLSASQPTKILQESLTIGLPNVAESLDYFDGIWAGFYIQAYADREFRAAYSELPCPRASSIILALTGELIESDALVEEASTMQNHATCTDITSGTRFLDVHEPVQFIGHHTSLDGRERNVVVVGGKLYTTVVP